MRELFIQVVNMSLTASWLIVAVMVSRVFLTRTSKSLVCFLWLLVGVRLILPISFESRMSVVPTLEPIVIHQVNEVVNIGEITVQGITNSYEVVTSLDWLSVVSFVWMIGVAVLLVYALYSYWQLHRKVAASIEIGKDIYICDDIDGAFILGIWNPKIYLPSSLPYTDRNYVLMHEFTHLKRKDYMIKPLAYAVLMFHWFNPLVWMSYVLLCKDMEMVCDLRQFADYTVERHIVLTHNDLKAVNTEADPFCVVPREGGVSKNDKGDFCAILPAKSWNVIRLQRK